MSQAVIKNKKVHKAKKRLFRTSSNRSTAGNVFLVIVLALMAVIFLFPVIFMVNSAFKPMYELLKYPPDILVKNPTLSNFSDLGPIFTDSLVPLSRYLFNTIFIVVTGTLGQIVVASMAAYPLAKYEFRGNKAISGLIVMSLMFSTAVTSIPNYIIISALGMTDTYLAVIVPVFSATLGLYLMKNFMEQVPSSIIESANIDGASEFKTLWLVVMPAVKPAWITLFIYSFQTMWGEMGNSFLYNETLKPLSYVLWQIALTGIARQNIVWVAALIMFVIPVILYIFLQSNVLETMTTSGMKE